MQEKIKVCGKFTNNINKKIFFITSNQSELDNNIEYSILENKGLSNFVRLCIEKINIKNENFTISVYCINIIQESLKEKHKDSELEKYEVIIKCKKNKIIGSDIFYGTILFVNLKIILFMILDSKNQKIYLII